MMLRPPFRTSGLMQRTPRIGAALSLALACAGSWPAAAQQLIGYVGTRDAEVTGASDVLNGQAVLTGSASVTARDHTAPILLGRGGTVRVCQTSALHITESRSADLAAPLLFSLDRGAVEIQMAGTLNDAIMTPDLRFTVVHAGPLDLRLRVARNGDTCVENRGAAAPTLDISDPFGASMYQIAAGQHVLFEHGNLHEVVDHEASPCGCPEERGQSIADALLASGGSKPTVSVPAASAPVPTPAAVAPAAVVAAPAAPPADPQAELQTAEQQAARAAVKAAEQHPFPTAISEGLAPAPAPAAPAAGAIATHTSLGDSLSYNAPVPAPAASPASPAAASAKKARAGKAAAKPAPATAQPPAPAPPASPPPKDLAHILGRFFKHIFGG
jgi:hypothetical protein